LLCFFGLGFWGSGVLGFWGSGVLGLKEIFFDGAVYWRLLLIFCLHRDALLLRYRRIRRIQDGRDDQDAFCPLDKKLICQSENFFIEVPEHLSLLKPD
jgi:hypothetical protein